MLKTTMRLPMNRHFRPAAFTSLLLASACHPAPPPTDQPASPQTGQHTQLRDAIQKPIDKARAVEDTLQKADEERRKQLEAAEQ
jgi:hypothetical protein